MADNLVCSIDLERLISPTATRIEAALRKRTRRMTASVVLDQYFLNLHAAITRATTINVMG